MVERHRRTASKELPIEDERINKLLRKSAYLVNEIRTRHNVSICIDTYNNLVVVRGSDARAVDAAISECTFEIEAGKAKEAVTAVNVKPMEKEIDARTDVDSSGLQVVVRNLVSSLFVFLLFRSDFLLMMEILSFLPLCSHTPLPPTCSAEPSSRSDMLHQRKSFAMPSLAAPRAGVPSPFPRVTRQIDAILRFGGVELFGRPMTVMLATAVRKVCGRVGEGAMAGYVAPTCRP